MLPPPAKRWKKTRQTKPHKVYSDTRTGPQWNIAAGFFMASDSSKRVVEYTSADLLQTIATYTPLVYTSPMTQSTVFKTNKTQAVRIPKAVAFPDHVKKVQIISQGNSLLITPIDDSWEAFFSSAGIGDDFERPPQPEPQRREDT